MSQTQTQVSLSLMLQFVSVQLARAEVDYHRRSLEMLEQLVPQLEEAVGMCCHLDAVGSDLLNNANCRLWLK